MVRRLPKSHISIGDNLQPRAVQQSFDQVTDEFNALASLPILDGVLKEDIILSSASNAVIKHGLQRVPKGWFVTNLDAMLHVRQVSSGTNSIFLELAAAKITGAPGGTVTSTVKIWVF